MTNQEFYEFQNNVEGSAVTYENLKKYASDRATVGAFRALSPLMLEDAAYVDADSCIYDESRVPDEVIAACPIVQDVTVVTCEDGVRLLVTANGDSSILGN